MFHTLYVLVCREIVVGNEVCPIVKKVGNHSTTLTNGEKTFVECNKTRKSKINLKIKRF